MDTVSFLARVVPASGNYLTIVWNSKGRGWGSRSYPPSQVNAAVSMTQWLASKGNDTYFALAAFNLADTSINQAGNQTVRAPREQRNVQYLKCLAIDADVKRPGDKKDPATTFPDRKAAVRWLLAFCQATGMPPPNAGVNSGYGLHWYWILDTELTLPEWQPLADALKAAMLAHQWVGDTSITVDSARILRLPGTQNYKSGTGVPVTYIKGYETFDYPKARIETALAPFVGMTQARTGTTGAAPNLGARPGHLGQGLGLNAAAAANLGREYSMATIATRCEQVKRSLAHGGNGDPYPLWYRDNLSLCAYTVDGEDFVHPLSKDDPRYVEANTNAAWARIKHERDTKPLGPPTCASFDADRRGVCPGCSWYGKIKTPIVLGADDGDLPDNYRRNKSGAEIRIERQVFSEKKGVTWVTLIKGDVTEPQLDELPAGGYRISFIYTLAGKTHHVGLNGGDLSHQMPLSLLENQHLAVDRHTAPLFADFVMAWITKLREQRAERDHAVKPFGWQHDPGGQRIGGAVGGTLYHTDGSIEVVPGGDPNVMAQYQPMGDLAAWRQVAALFEGRRPDLQALIATSFAGPLIGLAGDVRGMSLNFWSAASGIGKTTALRVGHAVWGDPIKGVQAMRDTFNAVMRSLSEPRFLTRFWDEMRVAPHQRADFVEMIFTIPVGKERSRLQSNIVLRETGEWETILVMTSNRAYADHLLQENEGTDSGVARLLEVMLRKQQLKLDGSASQTIKLLETNYGHAGRIYMQWLAQNISTVEAQLAAINKALVNALNIQQEERFYVAAATTIIVGASIAKKLGLFDFDVQAINQVLCEAIQQARAVRDGNTLVSPAGALDVEELVGQYLYEIGDNTLRTRTLTAGGGGKVVIDVAPKYGRLKAQIAQTPGLARIARNEFITWLRRRSVASRGVVDDLIANYQAAEAKKTLGGGTNYAGSPVWVIDLPLVGPFADLLDSGTKPTTTRAFGQALAGNQPTV